ncbi:DUF1905 domain-containing protein [Nocardia panacis]|uniref:DUF1905 domain-containing protein n=1 Tax=Nocardia panacis TaxID=2340916 RepID=A0A3A4KG70_9NOCA|nr:YdeI/OmpD-associated family protein [Nocardia panacis]RJO79909.1 DUF1905 domain-containing protein [Nocardia panacis]
MERFEGVIEQADGGGAYVAVPPSVIAALGGGARIPVLARFDGIDYQGSIVAMGAGPCLGMLKSIRAKLGKGPGDSVTVTLRRETAPRAVDVPEDLAAALTAAGARSAFDALSHTKRREAVESVTAAKKPETRARRIAQLLARLG